MAAPDVVDYVVVHELAHLREMNHGEKFWVLVKNVMPDYDRRKTVLKALAARLGYEDWDI
ncbi:hypothetical protein AGMMS49992_19710 [Clostridia bacterium]|nr:hypothetical protein AGMMS49992_19710 [Clostridia bacterium]